MCECSASVNQARIEHTTSAIPLACRWDHLLARWGVNRAGHRVEPGLYALGRPTMDSPVFVTANYTLSFDALRSALAGIDGYIMVLDTEGINVWCAAGKGTFCADEVVRQVEATGLAHIVRHRSLILPQLSAAGVAAQEVAQRSGFAIEYGPVRAVDLPAYLETRQATPEMRRVTFALLERLVLIPVELVHALLPMVVAAVIAYFVFGALGAIGLIAAVLGGTVAFPILLPWLPVRDFSAKGFMLGGIVAVPFALALCLRTPDAPVYFRAIRALAYLLASLPLTAFLALNFTGATPFTSRTAVRREIFRYVPVMAWVFGAGIVLAITSVTIRVLGDYR